MSARTLQYRTGLFSMGREIFFTLAQMGEEPLAAAYVPTFQAHRAAWEGVMLKEISHYEILAKAQAAVTKADRGIDAFATRVDRLVREVPHASTRNQLKKKLFKGKPLSKFRRPVLGRQLADMKDWKDVLAQSGVASLVAVAPEAEALYDAAKAADDQRAKAESDVRLFRDLGDRKAFVDALNASRKEVNGALSKLPFTNPALPQDFGDSFFYSEAPSDEEETIEDLKASIDALETELSEAKSRLADKEAEAAAAAKAAEDDEKAQKEADDLEAQAAALMAKAASLRGK